MRTFIILCLIAVACAFKPMAQKRKFSSYSIDIINLTLDINQ